MKLDFFFNLLYQLKEIKYILKKKNYLPTCPKETVIKSNYIKNRNLHKIIVSM